MTMLPHCFVDESGIEVNVGIKLTVDEKLVGKRNLIRHTNQNIHRQKEELLMLKK